MTEQLAIELIELLREHNQHSARRLELLEESTRLQRESMTLAYQNAALQARLAQSLGSRKKGKTR